MSFSQMFSWSFYALFLALLSLLALGSGCSSKPVVPTFQTTRIRILEEEAKSYAHRAAQARAGLERNTNELDRTLDELVGTSEQVEKKAFECQQKAYALGVLKGTLK